MLIRSRADTREGGGDGEGPPTGTAKTPQSQNQDLPSNQEHLRTRFYERYHKEADEYDGEFVDKCEEDLGTTLIFVRLVH